MPRYQGEIATAYTLTETPTTENEVKPLTVASEPIQLKISSLSVDTLVKPVGLNAIGDMDIDDNPTETAWYKLGPKPGEEGSAVIAGHYGFKNGKPSVFNDLNTLIEGDTITVVGKDGVELNFVVNKLAKYTPEQDATSVFKSDDGKAHLNLVTCQGVWVNSDKTYSDRLVVFTELIK